MRFFYIIISTMVFLFFDSAVKAASPNSTAPINECYSSDSELSADLQIFKDLFKLTIIDNDKKIECRGPYIVSDGRNSISPFYKVSFEIMGRCKPKLMDRLANKLRNEISFEINLNSKKSTLLWLAYQFPKPCTN